MLLYVALTIAVAATGWWGRYEYPVIAGVGAAGVYALAASDWLPMVDSVGLGLLLAYLRRSVVTGLPQSGDERRDVG